ncbi:uncharacterized protein (DUF427 family) [Nakamurella sp. UYEF19]|uniref:DUF427 domain-containing protein n=1 Tax=Nakamurella sp. UYEF19 TaxID=1756392 RepID=UPI00339A1E19
MVEAVPRGRVIAPRDDTVVVEGNQYFPPGSGDEQYLQASRTKSSCPWQGVAFYDPVQVDRSVGRTGAWTYRHPSPLARRIRNHVAFWGDVTVQDTGAGTR